MYLRRQRRTIEGATYEYWALVESRRTASGPRQHTVATLGKLPGLDGRVRAGWEAIDELLEGRTPACQLELGGEAQPEQPLLLPAPLFDFSIVLRDSFLLFRR
jgi:hypothetical protein